LSQDSTSLDFGKFEPPSSIRALFIAAGWRPGRNVSSLTPLSDHPASAILSALCGLAVRPAAAKGLECATSDLKFELSELEFSSVAEWEVLLGVRLIGVAAVHRRHGILFVASDDRCFVQSCVDDVFSFAGATFSEAASRMLLGQRARPMLRPEQTSISLYGIPFERDSPDVYQY